MRRALLVEGECQEVMRKMADNSVDAIVTDPPYGLNSGRERLEDIFFPTLFNVFFPKFHQNEDARTFKMYSQDAARSLNAATKLGEMGERVAGKA